MENLPGPAFDPLILCARIGQGDRDAESELLTHFQRRIRAFLAGRIAGRSPARDRDGRLAEELCQDVLLALLCALREGRLREPDQLASFAYAIARNHLNDLFRKQAREKLESLPEGLDLPSPPDNPDEAQRLLAVEREMANLDRQDRTILSLTLVDGLKPGEIASRLRLTSEVVRQRKSRAIKKLAARLGFGSQTATPGPLREGKS